MSWEAGQDTNDDGHVRHCVDVKSVTVVRMTVARQSLNKAYSVSHQNQRNCADTSSRALEANKHGVHMKT